VSVPVYLEVPQLGVVVFAVAEHLDRFVILVWLLG
jgi:hypothetical protein